MSKVSFDLPGVYADLPEVIHRLLALTGIHGPDTVEPLTHGRRHTVRVHLGDPDDIWGLLLQARTVMEPGTGGVLHPYSRPQRDAAKLASTRISNALHTRYSALFPIGQDVDTPDGRQSVTRITIAVSAPMVSTHADGKAHAWTATNLLNYRARLAAQAALMS